LISYQGEEIFREEEINFLFTLRSFSEGVWCQLK